MTTSVDQRTQRRRGVGRIAHDPERAFQGYTLFTPQFRGGPSLLIDMEGKAIHEWRTPLATGYGHLLPYEAGVDAFRQDIAHAKVILEDITGEAVRGFRAAGFGITERAP